MLLKNNYEAVTDSGAKKNSLILVLGETKNND